MEKTTLNLRLTVVILISVLSFPAGLTAQSMETVLDRLGRKIERRLPGNNANKVIQSHITEKQSGTVDEVAATLGSRLKLKIRGYLLQQRPYSEPKDPLEVQIKGTYERDGINIKLTLVVSHFSPAAEQIKTFREVVHFEYLEDSEKKHVVILNIQSNELDKTLNDRFSNQLRDEIRQGDIYTLRRNAFRPDVSGCLAMPCLIAVGRQLDVDFLLLPRLDKIETWQYVLRSDLIDVRQQRVTSGVRIRYNGRLSFLSGAISDLAMRLVQQERITAAVEADVDREQGNLSVTSDPSEADIYLDDKRLAETTNVLLEKIPTGMHTVVIKKGALQRTFEFSLNSGEIKQLHAVLKPFNVASFTLVKDPLDPLKTGFKVEFSLALDLASVTDRTFFVQKGRGKLSGTIETVDDTVIFKPDKPLQYDKTYKIVATRGIRSKMGDVPDLPYERRYRAFPLSSSP